ncbi:MAG: hypothetical protein ACWA5X_11495 [bacterium]
MDLPIGLPCNSPLLCNVLEVLLVLFLVFLAIGVAIAVVQKTREFKASKRNQSTEKPPHHSG